MAFATYMKHWLVILILIFISFSTCKFGRAYDYPHLGAAGVVANEYLPEAENEGGGSGYLPQGGVTGSTSPDLIIDKALECFNDKYIYSSCDEAYRLTQQGDLNVPPDYTDQYCNGPCITETHRVLACIYGILTEFTFYNEASLSDVRDTIESGCSYGPKRGNFNVAEHIQANGASADKLFDPILYANLFLISMMYNVVLSF